MTALAFLACLAAIFTFVLATEDAGLQKLKEHRPTGLLTWLTQGNWPAKIGATLVIVGVGALLRYALLNIDIPPQMKLISGVAIALALGLGSTFVPAGPARRAVSLALAGAAFGVIYLTAYSAFALFNYLSNPLGLALLAVTSAAAGVYAVTRSAQSMAVLSMVGAFLSPAFGVDDPGPMVVYGYYVGASLLTLAMVALRGWRPLIHLSFLFTLAGGVFFAWTASYYDAAHANVMLPMIVVLAAIHVTMPIVEKSGPSRLWVERLDLIFMLTLPAVAALLAVFVAPSRGDLSVALLSLGVVWLLAAGALSALRKAGVAAHAVIGAVLLLLGLVTRFKNLPWELVGLAFAVAALALAARRQQRGRVHGILSGLVLLFAAAHILTTMAAQSGPEPFGGVFIERIVAAMLIIAAGVICRRIGEALDTLLLAVGILWAFVSIAIELVHWDLATLALVVHWFFILAAASLWIPGRRVRAADAQLLPLVLLIAVTAGWSALQAGPLAAWMSLVVAPLALLGVAVRPIDAEFESSGGRVAAVLAAPIVAAIWAFKAQAILGDSGFKFFPLVIGLLVAITALFAGQGARDDRTEWLGSVMEVFGVVFATLLAGLTLGYIVREPSAIVAEVLCLIGLVFVAQIRRLSKQPVELAHAACVLGAVLMAQANVMRLLGTADPMDLSDVFDLKWPALLSLLWAIAGAGLAIWAGRVRSRTLWVSGAVLLVAAAAKVFIVDFGSLGQLANILAVIAAGGMFLLVGWLAPMPPARSEPADGTEAARSSALGESGGERAATVWMIALLLGGAAALFFKVGPAVELSRAVQNRWGPVEVVRGDAGRYVADAAVPIAAPVVPRTPDVESPPISGSPTLDDVPDAAPAQMAPVAAVGNVAAVRPTYRTPPVVDGSGQRSYTQYSYPQANAENSDRRSGAESARSAGSYRTPPVPAAKEQGLDQLMREGRLRRATPRDIEIWRNATGNTRMPKFDGYGPREPIMGYYVVLREMTYPEGLYGAHSVTFILPRGVARPFGNPGHSRVLETAQ